MTPPERPALPQAFFLPAAQGARFAVFHPAQGAVARGSVLYLHPFAEELNATRRVVARQARALAQAGHAVLQIDLLGCGDSFGELADATWTAWREDARAAHAWLKDQVPGPRWLWGMRAGALLAAELAAVEPEPVNLLFWQPAASGQQVLRQFLRLHAAGQWLGESGSAPKTTAPAQALAAGETVDIAGYRITPALAQGLGATQLRAPQGPAPGRLVWLEASPQAEPALGPASEAQLSAWRAAGWQVQAQAVSAPPFWQTVGTDEAPRLASATLACLAGEPPPCP